jgi:hypothetical protein
MSPQGTVRYKTHFFSLEKKKQEIKKENQKIARKQRK